MRDENLYQIDYGNDLYNEETLILSNMLVSDNISYIVSQIDTLKYINNPDRLKVPTEGSLLLTKINLKDKIVEHSILKDKYKLNESHLGLITGFSDLPMVVKNNKLYVFTLDKKVYIIENENKIRILDMPYEFQGSLSKRHLYAKNFDDNEDFWGSAVKVGDDGNIYILNLFPEGKLTIHKLLEDSTYELLWEGQMPKDVSKKTYLNTFEILNYN